jgi:hypothetical protein
MTDDLPPRADPAADTSAARPVLRLVTPLEDDAEETEGGDPVCWAFLVCDECGAITTEGHRSGCPQAHGVR